MPQLPPQVARLLALAFLALAGPALAATGRPPAGPGEDCGACHLADYKAKVVHPPVANGLCGACHRSTSQTAHTFALSHDDKQMCRQCHGARDSKKVVHGPIAEGLCLNCHDPHASDNHVRLRRTIYDTCTACHPSRRIQNETSLTKHGALDPQVNPKVCVACHDPHEADAPASEPNNRRRLKAWPPMNLCFTCHDKPLQTETGKIINMKEWVESHPDNWMRHGPVREGQCPQCHDPHGTPNWRMLKRSFPGDFYSAYEEGDTYGLCFGCHDRRLVETPRLAEKAPSNKDPQMDLAWTKLGEGDRLVRKGVTGFRNGDENLHVRHVNKIDKGRTCRACHDFHASPNPKHIKTTTKFGAWEFSLNYEKTQTGGSCWPGCHVRRRYDRDHRQENPR